ncbi:MAG TPA: DUF4440 domain-containing protein [Thermoanaerobaculia bacterium]|nr:DUF4440 domain-containing protein [Thermoanaerobaculia bacterium]
MRLVPVLILGMSIAAAATTAARSEDAEDDKAALLRTDKEFSDAAQKVGVGEAFLRYADENATMLPAGDDAATGLDAIKQQFADYPKGATLVWKPVRAEVAQSGDLGYTIGTYETRGPGPDGRFVTRYGKYCSVWKKQKDGGWKWVVDVGTPSPAPRD